MRFHSTASATELLVRPFEIQNHFLMNVKLKLYANVSCFIFLYKSLSYHRWLFQMIWRKLILISIDVLHAIGEDHCVHSTQEPSTSSGPSMRPPSLITLVRVPPIRGRGRSGHRVGHRHVPLTSTLVQPSHPPVTSTLLYFNHLLH